MSEIVDSLYIVHNNAFLLSPLLKEFYINYHGQDKDILLSYLVLPLVLHENTKITLKKSNVTSSLQTFGRNNDNYFGLPERVSEYKDITNKCLQYLIENGHIKINDKLSVEVSPKALGCDPSIKESKKSSKNLVKILRDYDIVTIYRLLGIKKL